MDMMIFGFGCLGLIFTGVSVYGAINLKRKPFLFGLYLYSFLPIIAESLFFVQDKELFHLLIIIILESLKN